MLSNPFAYEVKISSKTDPYGASSISWLLANKLKPGEDWQIDMHGGLKDHTSFWFKDEKIILVFKLTCG